MHEVWREILSGVSKKVLIVAAVILFSLIFAGVCTYVYAGG